jgi:hypothetical protein
MGRSDSTLTKPAKEKKLDHELENSQEGGSAPGESMGCQHDEAKSTPAEESLNPLLFMTPEDLSLYSSARDV